MILSSIHYNLLFSTYFFDALSLSISAFSSAMKNNSFFFHLLCNFLQKFDTYKWNLASYSQKF